MAHTAMIEKTVYDFSELSDSAKDNAIAKYACNYDWWDSSYDDFVQVLEILGFDVQNYANPKNGPNIEFSGFSHQGSYAAFSGSYCYRKNMMKAIKEYAPKDEVLHEIASALFEMQRTCFYALSAKFTYSYYRGYSIDMEDSRRQYGWMDSIETEGEFRRILKKLSNWIYDSLEKEYEYRMSYECFQDECDANEYTFDSNGNIDYI